MFYKSIFSCQFLLGLLSLVCVKVMVVLGVAKTVVFVLEGLLHRYRPAPKPEDSRSCSREEEEEVDN